MTPFSTSHLGFRLLVALALAATPRTQADTHEFGRLETHEGLRILRLRGTPEQRGYAHGKLLGIEIADVLRAEYAYRFAERPQLLDEARRALPRLITYPDAVRTELEAMFRGIRDSGADLDLPDFERPIDLADVLFVNALDVFGTMACSGFTVWGDMVEGGGVLTSRNFDWPLSGPHLVSSLVLAVHEPDEGNAFATVAWPGYVGAVTAVNEDGVAVFLHVGSGDAALPEPDSMPTAIAAREILQWAEPDEARARARRVLEETSPPASYITRLVLPRIVDGAETPVAVFETDVRRVSERERDVPCVVTNHFAAHRGGTDSRERLATISARVDRCLETGDERISVAEAWDALREVDRSGGFATLHSLVFRAVPWSFELAIAGLDEDGRAIAAPRSGRRFALPRQIVFPGEDARESDAPAPADLSERGERDG